MRGIYVNTNNDSLLNDTQDNEPVNEADSIYDNNIYSISVQLTP